MKKLNLIFIFLSVAAISLISVPAYSHVIPEDELRNQVYLSTNEALKKVFEGVHKIKREKRKTKDQRIEFYIAQKNDQKIYATIGKATANSHPVTKAKFVLLIDSQGQVKDLHIMEYRGPQRAEIISRTFLDQYMNKSAETDFSAVTSNQGPTPSVQALSQAVHELLILYKILYQDSRN